MNPDDLNAKELMKNSQYSYFNSLSAYRQDAFYDFWNILINESNTGKFFKDFKYSDEEIPSGVFALFEDDAFYGYLSSLGFDTFYEDDKGTYYVGWKNADNFYMR